MDRVSMKKLRKIILQLLSNGHPSLVQAAEILEISPRTLQRKMAKENMSYKQLVEDIRYHEACRLLINSKKNICDISTLLGYADAGSFTRAFSRWYGSGPKQYRIGHKNTINSLVKISKHGNIYG
jgi:AraC-like DNA-binding protein